MAIFEILETSKTDNWRAYLQYLPLDQQDIYYAPEYYKLYEEINDGKAKCFVFQKDNDTIMYPFLINSINYLGYDLDKEYYDIQGAYGYNGFIASTKSDNILSEFHEAFSSYCKDNNIIAEFTRFHPLLKNERYANKGMTIIKDRETVFIDLTKTYSDIWEAEYASKNRNMIRKAVKLGYKIEILESPEEKDLNTFIDIYYYSMNMANADKYYFFDKEYFRNIFKYLKGKAYLFNVLDNESQVVCSSIFLRYGDYFHYHFSGRNQKADNSTNNFLLDRAVNFAQNTGAKYFHLGGGRSTKTDDSLLKFKKSFSKETLAFYIGKKIRNQSIYDQVVAQWADKYPDKIDKYKNHLLKYRYCT